MRGVHFVVALVKQVPQTKLTKSSILTSGGEWVDEGKMEDVDAGMTQWRTSVTSSISLSQAVALLLPEMLLICKQERETPGFPGCHSCRQSGQGKPLSLWIALAVGWFDESRVLIHTARCGWLMPLKNTAYKQPAVSEAWKQSMALWHFLMGEEHRLEDTDNRVFSASTPWKEQSDWFVSLNNQEFSDVF